MRTIVRNERTVTVDGREMAHSARRACPFITRPNFSGSAEVVSNNNS